MDHDRDRDRDRDSDTSVIVPIDKLTGWQTLDPISADDVEADFQRWLAINITMSRDE
jgi:hypothetical protein